MQSLWRRYRAVLRVSKLSHIRRKHRAATKIQKVGRGMLGRLTVKDIHERHAKATLIQYFFWCFKARKGINFYTKILIDVIIIIYYRTPS